MKFLKKASLAASIAAVSFAANAELVAMDEMSMAATTGQAGVDIDITLGYDATAPAISVGEVLYRDTDTDGGVSISNIQLSSATGDDIVLTNAIDILANGDITITSGDVDGLHLHIDSVDTVADSYVVGGSVKAANLVGTTDLYMNLTGGTTTITQTTDGDTVMQMRNGAVEIVSGVDLDGDGALESSSTSLLNNAITVGGLKVYGAAEGTGISTQADVTFSENGIAISNLNLAGTIEIAELGLGGTTDATSGDFTPSVIGSLAISNIQLNNASITISGH
jgi:hypothetical protein